MTLVSDVVDGLLRDYLTPPSEQPVTMPLDSTVDASTTTITYTDGFLQAIEESSIGVGTLIEIEQEIMRVLSITPGSPGSITVATRGGILGTTAAAHTIPQMIVVRPEPSRLTVFNAVADAIVSLYPRLYTTGIYEFSSTDGFIEVPDEVQQLIEVQYRLSQFASGTSFDRGVARFFNKFGPTNGKVIQLEGIPVGRECYLVYKKQFDRPTDETYDLENNGLETHWVRIVALGALIQLLAALDIDTTKQDYITDALETQGFPVGSGESVTRAAIRVYEYLLGQATDQLRVSFPPRVVTTEV